MLSIASAFAYVQVIYFPSKERAEHTDDPVCIIQEVSARFLSPYIDSRVYFYPAGYLFQRPLDTLDFWCAYICKNGCGMSV